jgi:integrase
MALWKDGKSWRFEFSHKKKRYWGTGYYSRDDARKACEKLREKVKRLSGPRGQMTFNEAAESYLVYCQRRHPSKEYKFKALVFRRFSEYFEETGVPPGKLLIAKITPEQILWFLASRPTNSSYNNHCVRLQSLWSYARDVLRIIDYLDNPFRSIKKLPHNPQKGFIPAEKDVLRLLMASDPITERPLIKVILYTWARIDEVLRLRWDDVNMENKEITFYCRKNQQGSFRERRVFMNDELMTVMRRLYMRRIQDEWVFYNEATGTRYNTRPRVMKSIICRINAAEKEKVKKDPSRKPKFVRDFGFHALRRFGATYAKDRLKAESKTVQDILGHASLATTERYLGSIPASQREVLKAMEGRFATNE